MVDPYDQWKRCHSNGHADPADPVGYFKLGPLHSSRKKLGLYLEAVLTDFFHKGDHVFHFREFVWGVTDKIY